MDMRTGMYIIFGGTSASLVFSILVSSASKDYFDIGKLEREYKAAFGEWPLKPYNREGAGRLAKLSYYWKLRTRDGGCLINMYEKELKQAIREGTPIANFH